MTGLEGFFDAMRGTTEHPIYGPVHMIKELDDGRDIMVTPSSFGTSQIRIGERNGSTYDDMW